MSSCAKTQISHPRSPRFGQSDVSAFQVGRCTQSACAQVSPLQNTTASRILSIAQKPSLPNSTGPSSSPYLTFLYSNQDLLVVPPDIPCFFMLCHFVHALSPPAIPSTHSSFPKSSSKWLQFILQMLSSDRDFLLWKASSEIPLTRRFF